MTKKILTVTATLFLFGALAGTASAAAPTPSPPTITEQPKGGLYLPGQSLTVVAEEIDDNAANVDTLSYQWFVGGEAIEGATSASYTLPLGLKKLSQSYFVVVTATDQYGFTNETESDTITVVVP